MKRFLFAILALLLFQTPAAFASLMVSPSWADLGEVDVSDLLGRSRNVMVRNNSNETVRVSVQDLGCILDFRVRGTFCSVLAPQQSCQIQVTFNPRTVGYKSCRISVRASDGSSGSVQVTGRGVKR